MSIRINWDQDDPYCTPASYGIMGYPDVDCGNYMNIDCWGSVSDCTSKSYGTEGYSTYQEMFQWTATCSGNNRVAHFYFSYPRGFVKTGNDIYMRVKSSRQSDYTDWVLPEANKSDGCSPIFTVKIFSFPFLKTLTLTFLPTSV